MFEKGFWLVVGSLLFFLSMLVASAASAADPLGPYRAVCEIQTQDGQGSGTLIGTSGEKALVLSCRHVADKKGNDVKLVWRWAGNQETKGEVVRVEAGPVTSFDNDLALIVCDRPRGVEPVKVVKFDRTKGPWVMAGYREQYLRVTWDDVAWEVNERIIVQRPIMKGMSGGPLFNRHGEIVGVVVASNFTTRTIAADGPTLHRMIDDFRKDKATEFIMEGKQ